jgi:D-glycero-D-manno-heptose 1,7-bisphosphate phosphatase
MLLELIERFGANAADTIMVGDTPADIQAGVAAGCRTWLVRSGHGQATLDAGQVPETVAVCDDLAAVVRVLLSQGPSDRGPA